MNTDSIEEEPLLLVMLHRLHLFLWSSVLVPVSLSPHDDMFHKRMDRTMPLYLAY